MANTLVVAGGIDDYGATHGEDLVVPFRKPPSSRPSWKAKKVVVGMIMGVTAAIVVASATVFWSVLRDASSTGLAQTGQSFLLQFYPYVTITNKTPYDVRSAWTISKDRVSYLGCTSDFLYAGLPAGKTWTASSRGLCLVNFIHAILEYQTDDRCWHWLACAPYTSSGTSHSIYSILMKGDNECCIRSSHELQECPAVETGMQEFWCEKNDARFFCGLYKNTRTDHSVFFKPLPDDGGCTKSDEAAMNFKSVTNSD